MYSGRKYSLPVKSGALPRPDPLIPTIHHGPARPL